MPATSTTHRFDHDVVVIGSGSGGSVTALRLAERNDRVAVLEAGRRFGPDTLPLMSWVVRNFLRAPALGCYGIHSIHLLRDAVILAGAGVGGGSLNDANTLYEALASFYADRRWAHITDWRVELAPLYQQAKFMLGITESPRTTEADRVIRLVVDGDLGKPPGQPVPDGHRPGRASHGLVANRGEADVRPLVSTTGRWHRSPRVTQRSRPTPRPRSARAPARPNAGTRYT